MAYYFGGATTDSIAFANATFNVGGGARTLSFWLNRDDTPATNEMILNFRDSTAAYNLTIYVNGVYGMLFFIHATAGSGYMQAGTTARTTLNAWTHVTIVWDGSVTAANTAIYYDGSLQTHSIDEDGGGSPRTLDGTWYIGHGPSGSLNATDGIVAFPAMWSAALTAGEIAALANGYHPRSIRPGALEWAPDLTRNSADPISGLTGTVTGASVYDNPRIIMPRKRRQMSVVAAASLPALSASTFVAGSLTSTGWRPQITAS